MNLYSNPTTVSARQMQRGYKKVFSQVQDTQEPVIVIANNTPQAAIISLDMLETFSRLLMQTETWKSINAIQEQNANLDPNQVYAQVTDIVEQVRSAQHAQENQSIS